MIIYREKKGSPVFLAVQHFKNGLRAVGVGKTQYLAIKSLLERGDLPFFMYRWYNCDYDEEKKLLGEGSDGCDISFIRD